MTISLSKSDTQKINQQIADRYFDAMLSEKNFRECPKGVGIYVLYHQGGSRRCYLYVGASIKIENRAIRFFCHEEIKNFYLSKMVGALPKNELFVGVKFHNDCDIEELAQKEMEVIQMFRPLFNASHLRYCKTNHKSLAV